MGSLCEVETQLYVAFDLKYINEERLNNILISTDELKRMIIGFKKRIIKK